MRNLSIGKKLLGGFISVLFLLIVIMSINLIQLISLNDTYKELIEDRTKKMLQVKDMVIAVKAEQIAVRLYAMLGDETSLQAITSSHDTYKTISKELLASVKTKEMIDLINQSDLIENEYFELAKEVSELKKQNKEKEFTTLLSNQGRTIIAQFEGILAEMEAHQKNLLDESTVKATKQVDGVISLVILLGIAALVLGIGIALFMGRLISKPIVELAQAAEKIASGDLTGKPIIMRSDDEIGKLSSSFNMMSNSLRSLIMRVGSNAEQVAASSEELSASAEQTSLSTEQIATTIQDVAAGVDRQVTLTQEGFQTINEMSIGFQQIAASTQNVSAKAAEASEKAISGNASIQTAVVQMNTINDTVVGLSEVIGELGGKSKQINQIVGVITELSAQTNLLSLNAAIEAARAGEHGRGFEVVAAEVRKLSQQSAESAQQINTLITSIQKEMSHAAQSMEKVTTEVHTGISIVHTAGQSFEYIREAAEAVATESEEVSASVQQMTAGVDEMTGSMRMIAEVTENSAAGTEQVTASTQEQLSSMEEISSSSSALAKMAEELQQTISHFKV
ncbi:methyl-accepting chemotaxis protein [Paenibacillus sinopodophylli]|uniref:methyl-accepting chemotaxis protein n=1 Tax=Paenibacillus sinopodophylli TaxID=1837342 RepID=UPI00110CBB7F|nr:methyl-accepting chemotaxis protein [Paenibacillus sinopodophylli]